MAQHMATTPDRELVQFSLTFNDAGASPVRLAACFMRCPANGTPVTINTTEVVQFNGHTPVTWACKFLQEHHFSETQNFKFVVYDARDTNGPVTHLAEVPFTLASLVMAQQGTLHLPLSRYPGANNPFLTVQMDKPDHSKIIFSFKLSAHSLILPPGIKNETYIEMYMTQLNGAPGTLLWRSAVQHGSKTSYNGATFGLSQFPYPPTSLQDRSFPQQITIRLCQGHSATNTVGEITLPLDHALQRPMLQIPLRNITNGQTCGYLNFDHAAVTTAATFIDYMRSGLDLNLQIAIDFSTPNGLQADSLQSLHHVAPPEHYNNFPNQFIDTIRSVGNVLAQYTRKSVFPVYGFGAEVPHPQPGQPSFVSHCFPLTLDPANPNCTGIEGVVEQYKATQKRIKLAGPSRFANVISAANQSSSLRYSQTYQGFNILLIITDGLCHDINDTIDQICIASDKPLSIVIVGVGRGPFQQMELLDGDDAELVSQRYGKVKRDIVQFVPFIEHYIKGPQELAKAVLDEIPDHVLTFMRMHRVAPLQPAPAPPPQQPLPYDPYQQTPPPSHPTPPIGSAAPPIPGRRPAPPPPGQPQPPGYGQPNQPPSYQQSYPVNPPPRY